MGLRTIERRQTGQIRPHLEDPALHRMYLHGISPLMLSMAHACRNGGPRHLMKA